MEEVSELHEVDDLRRVVFRGAKEVISQYMTSVEYGHVAANVYYGSLPADLAEAVEERLGLLRVEDKDGYRKMLEEDDARSVLIDIDHIEVEGYDDPFLLPDYSFEEDES